MGPGVEGVALPVGLVLRLGDVSRPRLPAFSSFRILRTWIEPHSRVECDLRPIRRPARGTRVGRNGCQPTPLAALDRHHVELTFPAGSIREKGQIGAVAGPSGRGVAFRSPGELDRPPAIGRRDMNGRAILVLLRVDRGHRIRHARPIRRDVELGDRLECEEVGGIHAVRKIIPAMTGVARSEWLFTKTEAVAPNGMVTSDPRPAEAGVEILREGGNALDAALATAFALGVTSPIGSGLGGIAGLVVSRDGDASSFDGSTLAPIAARPDMFELAAGDARTGMYGWPAVKGDVNIEGPLSVSVPGAVAAYQLAHRRFGKLPWRRLFEPAIRLAADGLVSDWYGTLLFGAYAARLHRNAEAKRVYYRAGGAPYRPQTG